MVSRSISDVDARPSALSRRRQGHLIDQPAACRTAGRFGIVLRQAERLTIPAELPDRAERCAGQVIIGADAVYPIGEHQSLIIRRVACVETFGHWSRVH